MCIFVLKPVPSQSYQVTPVLHAPILRLLEPTFTFNKLTRRVIYSAKSFVVNFREGISIGYLAEDLCLGSSCPLIHPRAQNLRQSYQPQYFIERFLVTPSSLPGHFNTIQARGAGFFKGNPPINHLHPICRNSYLWPRDPRLQKPTLKTSFRAESRL